MRQNEDFIPEYMKKSSAEASPLSLGERIGLKCIKVADKTVQSAVDIIFLLILLIGIYFLLDTIHVFNHSRASVTMPYKPAPESGGDITVLKELSEDCICWLTLDDTSIDYPVMQGVDNYEYLNKDPYGDYSLAGSVFLDVRNASDFSDEYSLLYGHHMSGGHMFGALDAYIDRSFFETHLTGTIYSERGELPIRVLAFAYTDANNRLVFDTDDDHAALREWIRENSDHYNAAAEDGRIVALSTCKSPASTRRMVVFVTIQE